MTANPLPAGPNAGRSVEHCALSAAKTRCNNPRCAQYPLYGGRGIRVCAEWFGSDGFAKFLAHIGPRPGPEYSLDRIDNDGDYEPGNVRWATQTEQTNNTRRNVFVEWRCERHTVSEWSRIVGVPHRVLGLRLARGWDIDRAMLTKPIAKDEQPRGRGTWVKE